MGLLIDSTVFVTAERRQETASVVAAGILEEYGDVDLALSVMSAGRAHPRVLARRLGVTTSPA